jgi:hypothetical protein
MSRCRATATRHTYSSAWGAERRDNDALWLRYGTVKDDNDKESTHAAQ